MKKGAPSQTKYATYSSEFKEQAIRLWKTGDYASQAALAKHLKMKNPRPLSSWIHEEETTEGTPGLIVMKKLELAGIEAHLEKAIEMARDTLSQLPPEERAKHVLQFIDRLTELRKNIVILPGDFGDGTGIITHEDATKILALVPEEGRAEFINALKEVKKL